MEHGQQKCIYYACPAVANGEGESDVIGKAGVESRAARKAREVGGWSAA